MPSVILKLPGAPAMTAALTPMVMPLPWDAGYAIKMHCHLGRCSDDGVKNEVATLLLRLVDCAWQWENSSFVVFGDAELVGTCSGTADLADLEAYVRRAEKQLLGRT